MPVRYGGGGGAGGEALGATNVRTEVTPGIELTQRLGFSNDEPVEPGIQLAQGPTTTRAATQQPGIQLTPSAIGATQTTQQPGIQLTQRFAQSSSAVTTPAFEIVQATFALTKTAGASAVTESAVAARTDWTGDANAVGLNGVGGNATFAGNATGARGGRLDLAYANVTGKTGLTITLVQLLFYGNVAGTVANNADVRLQYDLGGAVTTLETITGNADFLTTPKTHDITAAVAGSWANIDALNAHVHAEAALGEIWTAALDAVVLRVLANVTDTL